MWYRDLTPPPDAMLERLTVRARHVHDVFLAAGEQAREWAVRGVPTPKWLPNAADRDLDQPQPPDARFACDIAFMGRGISPGDDLSRAEFLVALSKQYHVRVWGQNWGRWANELNWDGTAVYGADFARVCASAKIVLDIQPALWAQAHYDQYYASNRMVKILACGGFCLTQGGAALQRLFREGEHCGWYRSFEEGCAQVDRYLSNDALRAQVKNNAREYVWQHHMMENRVHNLLTGEPYRNPE
jgi:spore maturation protein CgeB